MGKYISTKKLTDTLSLSECTDGFWLHDKTRGMNISMRAKTEELAFTEALTYYQKRMLDIETKYKDLQTKVDSFLTQFIVEDEKGFCTITDY